MIPNSLYTVLAPTDSAFQALGTDVLNYYRDASNVDELQQLLKGHIIDGVFPSVILSNGMELETEASNILTVGVDVSGTYVAFSGTPAVQPDLLANNGIAHGIGDVLFGSLAPAPFPMTGFPAPTPLPFTSFPTPIRITLSPTASSTGTPMPTPQVTSSNPNPGKSTSEPSSQGSADSECSSRSKSGKRKGRCKTSKSQQKKKKRESSSKYYKSKKIQQSPKSGNSISQSRASKSTNGSSSKKSRPPMHPSIDKNDGSSTENGMASGDTKSKGSKSKQISKKSSKTKSDSKNRGKSYSW